MIVPQQPAQHLTLLVRGRTRELAGLGRSVCLNDAGLCENQVTIDIYRHFAHFIDRPELRQSVRGNLNRIEAYHQLRRAIILANGGEFRGNSEAELVIWNQCARLLINAIIFYNGSLLSAALKKYTALKDQAAVDIIKRISPLAWAHINMIGKLEFLVDMPNIDIDQIIADVDIF